MPPSLRGECKHELLHYQFQQLRTQAGLPEFSFQHIKTVENIPKIPHHIPNDHKLYQTTLKYVYQIAIKRTELFRSKPLQKKDFWFENIPSGNPVHR
jgi:phospholipid N-methyltransferase